MKGLQKHRAERNKPDINNIKLIQNMLPYIKDEVVTVENILAPLENKRDATPKLFIPVSKLFTDGFSITDPILPMHKFIKFLRKRGINIYSSVRSWQKKGTLTNKPKRFFLRLNDHDC